MRILILFLTLMITSPLLSQTAQEPGPNNLSTNPKPPKAKLPRPINLRDDIPEDIHKHMYRLKATTPGQTEVPIFEINAGKRVPVGMMPVGAVIKLEYFTVLGGRNFFAVPDPAAAKRSGGATDTSFAYIEGIYLEEAPAGAQP